LDLRGEARCERSEDVGGQRRIRRLQIARPGRHGVLQDLGGRISQQTTDVAVNNPLPHGVAGLGVINFSPIEVRPTGLRETLADRRGGTVAAALTAELGRSIAGGCGGRAGRSAGSRRL
jgi:hypothetical protein